MYCNKLPNKGQTFGEQDNPEEQKPCENIISQYLCSRFTKVRKLCC